MYSGAAPAAMGQMGQGLSEVGAGIARSIQSGYQGLGQGLAAGLTSAAQSIGGAMKELQSAKTSNKITGLLLDDPQYREMLGVKSDEDAQKIKDEHASVIEKYGQIGGAQFANQYLKPIQEYAAIGRQYAQQTDLANIQAETARRVGLTGALAPYTLGTKATKPFDPKALLPGD